MYQTMTRTRLQAAEANNMKITVKTADIMHHALSQSELCNIGPFTGRQFLSQGSILISLYFIHYRPHQYIC